jgi:hypothetical protein
VSRSDRLSRTAKIFLDDRSAASLTEAEAMLSRYVLQVDVGAGIERSPTRQVMFATIVNTASRSFLGGVRVRIADNPTLTIAWARGMTLAEATTRFGGQVVAGLDNGYPTVAIGNVDDRPPGATVLYPTWNGWTAGVAADPVGRLSDETECALAGLAAGGLAVSEAFQYLYGYPPAGRRTIGVSLWRPDLDWREDAAVGPPCRLLPASAWIIGLGHLGQAYCWALGCLPYAGPAAVSLMLQDFDSIIEANHSTSALADHRCIGTRKTRLVASRLEEVGFKTSITERAFDAHTLRVGDEPVLALAGLDQPGPRRHLDPAPRGFNLVLDGGLGQGPQQYLDILIHSFPASMTAAEAFAATGSPAAEPAVLEEPAYKGLIEELIREGSDEGEARCGAIEVAGRTVAAAFVGAVTSTLVLAEPLRVLNVGRRYAAVSLSLRAPEYIDTAPAPDAPTPMIPFVAAAA